jgi:hypothetical protein
LVIVTHAYRFALDPTPRQVGALLRHAGAARVAFNRGLARVKANLAQREAERSYGIAEGELTPALSWSMYAMRKAWNQAKDDVQVGHHLADGPQVLGPPGQPLGQRRRVGGGGDGGRLAAECRDVPVVAGEGILAGQEGHRPAGRVGEVVRECGGQALDAAGVGVPHLAQ